MWGLVDMCHTNAFIIYRQFHPNTTHMAFFKQLALELLYKSRHLSVPTRRLRQTQATGLVPLPTTPTTPTVRVVAAPCEPRKFPGDFKRACYVCMMKNSFADGKIRDNNGSMRKQYPRSYWGCPNCCVALCRYGTCWAKYHSEYFGQRDEVCADRF